MLKKLIYGAGMAYLMRRLMGGRSGRRVGTGMAGTGWGRRDW
jgi:hypothetical protein